MKKIFWTIALLVWVALVPSQAYSQNSGKTIFPSAVRTSTAYPLVSADQVNNSGNGVHCILDTTAYTSGTVTLTIQGKDPASLKYYTLLSGAGVASTSTNVYKVFPAATVTANVSANDKLPTIWRISIAGGSTPVSTNSVGCVVME